MESYSSFPGIRLFSPGQNHQMLVKLKIIPSFAILVNYIFSRVVKYGDYASQKHKKNMASIMTVSDEAYALLVLENSWDVWTQNYTTGDTGNDISWQ